jgi:catechol 2,3-dioxygenase
MRTRRIMQMVSNLISAQSSEPNVEDSTPLRAALQRITLESPDPTALAGFYKRALGFSFEPQDGGLVGSARERRLTLLQGELGRLSSVCYRVEAEEELDRLIHRLEIAKVGMVRTESDEFARAVRFSDPDGNSLVFVAGPLAPAAMAPEAPHGIRAARLQHLVLASSGATQLIEFYRQIVGFKISDVVLDEEGVVRTAFLNSGHEHHSLAVFAASRSRLDHFCFEAGDWGLIRDWADHFSAERISVQWGPGRHGPGNNLFVFIHDLDGNWVEVSAELEHVAPDRPAGTWRHEERTLNVWGAGLLRS